MTVYVYIQICIYSERTSTECLILVYAEGAPRLVPTTLVVQKAHTHCYLLMLTLFCVNLSPQICIFVYGFCC